jgi:hypothetical protein
MLWVYDVDDGQILAFTARGIEALREIINERDRTT